MHEIIAFFKDIFTLNNNQKTGLCQFKTEMVPVVKSEKLVLKASKEVKISDLMRKSGI